MGHHLAGQVTQMPDTSSHQEAPDDLLSAVMQYTGTFRTNAGNRNLGRTAYTL